jgi:DNA polymerase-3 subunit delta
MVEPVGIVRQVAIPRKELEPWLAMRAREGGGDLTPPAARALVESQGQEPGVLVAALEQLSDAFPGERITPDLVHRQFRGLGEQKTWDLCDRAFAKDLPGAIRSIRAIEAGGDDPLMVLGGISSRLRDLIRVRGLPDRMPPAQVAKAAGLKFDWQARRYQQQARNFSLAELVRLHGRVTEADRALKSGATGDVIMPALVTAIATR